MKKFYLLSLGFFLLSGIIHAQFSLTYNTHGLLAGNIHDYIIAGNANEGSAGAYQIWDFSDLKQLKSGGGLASNINSTSSLTGYPGLIEEANTIIEEDGNNFLFRIDENKIEHVGLITSNGTVYHYTSPLIKMKYPFTYNDKIEGNFSGYYLVNDVEKPIKGNYEVVSDGFGKLILPGGIELGNTLRVKTSRTNEYSPGSWLTTTTYRWYVPQVRYPVLVVIKQANPGSDSKTIKTAYYKNAANIPDEAEVQDIENTFNIYPNPYFDELTIHYSIESDESIVSLKIYDTSGRMLRKLINNQKTPKGDYDYKIN